MNKKKHWYDYLWIYTPLYLILGLFNILFAWLGMIEFLIPLFIALFGGGKAFCNKYCARGQLFDILGNKLNLSRKKVPPKLLSSNWFRYSFLLFFMSMFVLMIINTINVFWGVNDLKEVIKILWTFKVPFGFSYTSSIFPDFVAQFAFGMYGMMLTSFILGFVTMLFFRPRSWCVYCPMGTMTQCVCKIKEGGFSGIKSAESK